MVFRRGNNSVGKVHDIGPSPCVREISAFPTDIRTVGAASGADWYVSRKLIVSNVGAGTKLLQYTGADGVQQTIDCTNLQGVALEIEALSLDAATTVTKVLVFL
jgi:hypothetical protein